MIKYKVLGNSVMTEMLFTKISEIIAVQTADGEDKVEKFGLVVGIGPDVEYIKVGDEVLIPPMNTGREMWSLNDKAYAIFREPTAMVIKEEI